MRKLSYTYFLLSGLYILAGCTNMDEETSQDNQVSDTPIDVLGYMDEDVQTKAYGATGYQATTFGFQDQIGVFATRTRKDAGPVTANDLFHGFANIGYRSGNNAAALRNAWTCMVGTPIKAPLFPTTMLDIYAYYPHAGAAEQNAKTNIIINTTDLHNITFRIHQNQTQTNLNLCNIMRAVPELNKSYTTTKKVTLTFKHIMVFLEFHIYLDSTSGNAEEQWKAGDEVLLDRVVVLGNKISTEGSFDLVDPAGPNVKITTNATTANGSIYKADATGTPIVDGLTGATTGGLNYLRRHVIMPPAEIIEDGENVDPSQGEQGDMEVMLELRYLPAGASEPVSANRHYFVAKGTKFESGKMYIIKVPVKRNAPTAQKLIIVEENITPWQTLSGATQTYNFN